MTSQHRVPTGIRGLDVILDGGVLPGCVYLVRGEPGSGKTILANHICFNLAARGAACTYVSVLTEANDRLLAQLSRFEFYRPELVGTHVNYVAAYRALEEGGLKQLLDLLRGTVTKRPAQLLVVDGVANIREAAPDVGKLKRFIHDVQALAMFTQSSVLLLAGTDPTIEVEPEQMIVDGVIELTDELSAMRSLRHVQVRKLRAASQVRGKHTLMISDAGITVMPRAETRRIDDKSVVLPDPSTRVRFGIENLDRMLGGGLPAQSVTMLVGPTGAGKTTLGLQYLVAGAAAGEPALYFGFYERPPELIAKSARVGIQLADVTRAGDLQFVWQAPVEGILDVLAERLLAVVEKHRVRRLCIDGIHTFGRTIDYPDRLPDALAALQTELQKAGVTTLYTLESPDTFATDLDIPLRDISATAHNIVMLRYVEAEAEMHRLISVMKVRESVHDQRTYKFTLTGRGVVIADEHASAASVLAPRRVAP